jgi:hypothetical protein
MTSENAGGSTAAALSEVRLPGGRAIPARRNPALVRAGGGAAVSATDKIETSIAPSAIERAMAIFENFKQRDHAELVQARNTLTEHIFGQVAAGATDEHRLVVSGLTHLKSIEKMTAAER